MEHKIWTLWGWQRSAPRSRKEPAWLWIHGEVNKWEDFVDLCHFRTHTYHAERAMFWLMQTPTNICLRSSGDKIITKIVVMTSRFLLYVDKNVACTRW
jgi:hypothetical protein